MMPVANTSFCIHAYHAVHNRSATLRWVLYLEISSNWPQYVSGGAESSVEFLGLVRLIVERIEIGDNSHYAYSAYLGTGIGSIKLLWFDWLQLMVVWDGSNRTQGEKKCLVVVSGGMLRISERQAAGQGCVNQDAHSRSGETFFFFFSSRPGTTA